MVRQGGEERNEVTMMTAQLSAWRGGASEWERGSLVEVKRRGQDSRKLKQWEFAKCWRRGRDTKSFVDWQVDPWRLELNTKLYMQTWR